MSSYRRFATAVAVALVGTLVVPALADPAPACPEGPLACAEDVASAAHFEAIGADNFIYGQMVEIDYTAPDSGVVASAGGWGDSGLWTGVYLGGESYRYAMAQAK